MTENKNRFYFDTFTEAELRQIRDDLTKLPVVPCQRSCLMNPRIKTATRYRECAERVIPRYAITRQFLRHFDIPTEHGEGTPQIRECFHTIYYHRIITALTRHLDTRNTVTTKEND